MRRRWRTWTAGIVAALVAGMLAAEPAFAAGTELARRRFGLFSGLGTLCCLVVVVLILVGVFIGVSVSRRKRRPPE